MYLFQGRNNNWDEGIGELNQNYAIKGAIKRRFKSGTLPNIALKFYVKSKQHENLYLY